MFIIQVFVGIKIKLKNFYNKKHSKKIDIDQIFKQTILKLDRQSTVKQPVYATQKVLNKK